MKTLWYDFRHALCMGLMVPVLLMPTLLRLFGGPGEMPEFSAPEEGFDGSVSVTLAGGEVRSLEEYLTCVLLGEMPGDFPEEALKAQAVAARTYTRKAMTTGRKHDGALCTDAGCCQAFRTPEEYLRQGGNRENLDRVREAVGATDGLVLTYEGDYIEATFFSCSGGRTEDAAEVWGVDYPYLRATDSPGEEWASSYRDTTLYSRQELEESLGITLSGEASGWLGALERTRGGGVKTLVLGDRVFSGTELREKLRLRSTAFTAEPEGTGLRFETQGYGHRVGLSQCGANAMAREGADFREILAHYYPGTRVESEPIGKSVEN